MAHSRMFWRLFGYFGVLVLSSIAVLEVVVVNRVERYYLDQAEDQLRTRAVLVREVVRQQSPAQTAPLQQRMIALRQEIATRITLIAADGVVLADSERDPGQMENHGQRPEVLAARSSSFGSATRFSDTLHLPMMYVAMRAGDANLPVAYVRVALPLDTIEERLNGLRRVLWTTAAVAGAGALALAFWLARRVTQPVHELTDGAEQIAAGKYGHKIYAIGRDEVGTLARAFNRMSDRLAVQFNQLEADRQQLRTILSGMVEGVIALGADQRILFANERAAQLLEFQSQAAVGRRLWEVVRQRSLQDVVQHALASPQPHSEELNWNGATTRSLTVHAARLPGSPPRGAVLVLHDTSELRRLERLRQEFVANVSHELKTPLSVIQACVETLIDGAVDDPEHRGTFLQQIDDQGQRLHALILDLLSLARIESGTEVFAFEAVPLEPVVTACLERHRARAEANGQVLAAVPPDPGKVVKGQGDKGEAAPSPSAGQPIAAWADEEAIGQILDNLVDNALKYTPPQGCIRVGWRVEGDQVCLEVQDTGIGIPEHDLARIFERFYRVDKARSRQLGGTGLGLSIVKHLVGAMQGSVSATSKLDKGTTFTVRLPRAPVA